MKLGKLFLSLASLALLAGCNNKEDAEVAPSMTLDPETLSFENVLGEQRIKITSNVDWTVSDIPSWIIVNPTSGTASEEPVFVSVEVGNNGDRTERKATLSFASDKISKTLTVTQKAADAAFSLSEKALGVTYEAGTAKFEVRSNVAWTVSSDSEDFTVSPASGNGTAEVTVTYTENKKGGLVLPILQYLLLKMLPLTHMFWLLHRKAYSRSLQCPLPKSQLLSKAERLNSISLQILTGKSLAIMTNSR